MTAPTSSAGSGRRTGARCRRVWGGGGGGWGGEPRPRAPARVVAAGRTDAGVHALGQVAHFCTASMLPIDRLIAGLNALLPRDVSVREAADVHPDFHARRDAR